MKHVANHMRVCIGLLAVALLFVAAGGSGAWLFLPAAACMLMMGVMVWTMISTDCGQRRAHHQ